MSKAIFRSDPCGIDGKFKISYFKFKTVVWSHNLLTISLKTSIIILQKKNSIRQKHNPCSELGNLWRYEVKHFEQFNGLQKICHSREKSYLIAEFSKR